MQWYKRAYRYLNRPGRCAYIFLAPSLILLFLYNLLPLVMAFVLSLFDANLTLSQMDFVGLGNFTEAFGDARFLNSLQVTGVLTLVELPVQVFGAMIVAALLCKNSVRNKFFRSIYFLPVICSATAIGVMWKMILHSNIGLITYLLRAMGFGKINFLNTPRPDHLRRGLHLHLAQLRHLRHHLCNRHPAD